MKSTDLARRDREIRRSQKKEEMVHRRQGKRGERSVGDYISILSEKFFHDDVKIYNIKTNNEEIVELLKEIKEEIEDKQWDTILRKAVKKSGISGREEAFQDLKKLLLS